MLVEEILKIINKNNNSLMYDKTYKVIYRGTDEQKQKFKVEYAGKEYLVDKYGYGVFKQGDIIKMVVPCNDWNKAFILPPNSIFSNQHLLKDILVCLDSGVPEIQLKHPKRKEYIDAVLSDVQKHLPVLINKYQAQNINSSYNLFIAFVVASIISIIDNA